MEVGTNIGRVYLNDKSVVYDQNPAVGQLAQLALEKSRADRAKEDAIAKEKRDEEIAKRKALREFKIDNGTKFVAKLQDDVQKEYYDKLAEGIPENGPIALEKERELMTAGAKMENKSKFFTGFMKNVDKQFDLYNENPEKYTMDSVHALREYADVDNYDKIWEEQGEHLPGLELKAPAKTIQSHLKLFAEKIQDPSQIKELATYALTDPNNEDMRLEVMAAYKQLWPNGDSPFENEMEWFASAAQAYMPVAEEPSLAASLSGFDQMIGGLSLSHLADNGKWTVLDEEAINRQVDVHLIADPFLGKFYSKETLTQRAKDFAKNKFETSSRKTQEGTKSGKEKELDVSRDLFASNMMSEDPFKVKHAFTTMLLGEDAETFDEAFAGWTMEEVDTVSGIMRIKVKKLKDGDNFNLDGNPLGRDDQFEFNEIKVPLVGEGAREKMERAYLKSRRQKDYNYEYHKNPYEAHLEDDADVLEITKMLGF